MMLKFFFWILLLANAGLFAYQQGALEAFMPSGREPARIANQLNADKIRLIPPGDVKREPVVPAAPAPAAPAPVAAPEPQAAPPEPENTPAKEEEKGKPGPVLACVEFGNFNPEDAKRFSTRLDALALGDKVSQHPIQEVTAHIVYIPPQGDREAVEKKAEQLRQLGIEDFFVIQDNSALRGGISLGVFKQEEAARAHLTNLVKKGVRSARLGQRSTNTGMVAFQLRDIDMKTKNALDKIKEGFPKQGMHDCKPA